MKFNPEVKGRLLTHGEQQSLIEWKYDGYKVTTCVPNDMFEIINK